MQRLISKNGLIWAEDGHSKLGPFPAVIGKGGLTHQKQEGDLKTPIGTFPLLSAFGLLPAPETKMAYRQITPYTLCIDDPHSSHYNCIIEKNSTAQDWNSAEEMASFDPQYRYGLIIDSPAGSCLFIHVWVDKNTPTAGCIALAEEHLLEILAWLDPNKDPHLIQLAE